MKINWLYVIVAVLICAAIYFIDVGLHYVILKWFCMGLYDKMPSASDAVVSGIENGTKHASLVLPAAISAGAGILNGLLGVRSQSKANQQNIALQRETNALNYRMFQEGNEFNRQSAIDMFNRENAYNDPSAQADRLMNANLNPALVGENATATAGNGDASTPSSVSPGGMLAPQVQPVGSPFQSVFSNIEALASAFEKTSSGKLHEGQKQFVLEQAKSEILKQKNQEISNQILAAYGMKEADARVKSILKSIEEMDQQISTLVTQGKLNDAEAALKKLQAKAQENQNDLFDKTFNYLIQQEEEKVNLLRAEVDTEEEKQADYRASANEHNAGAEEKRESARINRETANQLIEMHDAIVTIKNNESVISTQERKIKCRTVQAEIDKILHDAETAGYNVDQAKAYADEAREKAAIAEKENKSYYWRIVTDLLGKALSAGAMVYGIKLGSKAFAPQPTPQNVPTDRGYRYDSKSGLYY